MGSCVYWNIFGECGSVGDHGFGGIGSWNVEKWGAYQNRKFRMNNSVKVLITFSEFLQYLVKRHVYLGWGVSVCVCVCVCVCVLVYVRVFLCELCESVWVCVSRGVIVQKERFPVSADFHHRSMIFVILCYTVG